MAAVTTSLSERAETIFDDLGYTVERAGSELRAQRKWRMVQVTTMPEPEEPPSTGELRCFVTWAEQVPALERTLERHDPDYEWAVIGVRDDDYTVHCEPT